MCGARLITSVMRPAPFTVALSLSLPVSKSAGKEISCGIQGGCKEVATSMRPDDGLGCWGLPSGLVRSRATTQIEDADKEIGYRVSYLQPPDGLANRSGKRP